MIEVSIIIPVFNAEKYLERCINSCIQQSLTDIEIILVDDCSTDSSKEIIIDFQNKYPNIIRSLFLPVNSRQGAARNRGIEIASGTYLAFVDADDWIEPDMCEKLYKLAIENNADMAGANLFYSYNGKDDFAEYKYSSMELGEKNKNNVGKYSYFCGLFWSRIYRKELITNNRIFFLEGVSYEDSFFNYMTALYANRVVKHEGAFYHYVYNPESTTKKKNDKRQYARLKVIDIIFEECKRRGLYKIYSNEIDFKYIYMLEGSIRPLVQNFDHPDRIKFKEIQRMIKRNVPGYRVNPYYNLMNKKKKATLELVVHFPSLIPVIGKVIFKE